MRDALGRLSTRLRYRLWRWLCGRPTVCPATSHGRIIYGDREASMHITGRCLYEDVTLGCWCGKIRAVRSDAVELVSHIGRHNQTTAGGRDGDEAL